MAAYPLAGLLTLRGFRLDTAQRALRAAEAGFAAARATREEQDQKLADYRRWKTEETDRRYRAVLGRFLTQKELEDFKTGLGLMATGETAALEAAAAAAAAEEAARDRLQAAKAARLAADQARQKIEFHQQLWRVDQAREADRREDLELEDFKPVLFAAEAGADDRA